MASHGEFTRIDNNSFLFSFFEFLFEKMYIYSNIHTTIRNILIIFIKMIIHNPLIQFDLNNRINNRKKVVRYEFIR